MVVALASASVATAHTNSAERQGSCDGKTAAFHQHRARSILKHAYAHDMPSKGDLATYHAHKQCIASEAVRKRLAALRHKLKGKLEQELAVEAVTPFPGPNGSRWAIPWYIVQCESGGDFTPDYGLTFGGAYGILVSTWAAYGGGKWASQANLAPPDAQHIVAHRVWVDVGPSAWACA